jgi:hypothetical protein
MPDDTQPQRDKTTQAPLDFQEHPRGWKRRGCSRVTRAINKDTELQPLVRWQFAEDDRRAFSSPTSWIRGAALRHAGRPRRLAASPRIYALDVASHEKIGETWAR